MNNALRISRRGILLNFLSCFTSKTFSNLLNVWWERLIVDKMIHIDRRNENNEQNCRLKYTKCVKICWKSFATSSQHFQTSVTFSRTIMLWNRKKTATAMLRVNQRNEVMCRNYQCSFLHFFLLLFADCFSFAVFLYHSFVCFFFTKLHDNHGGDRAQRNFVFRSE